MASNLESLPTPPEVPEEVAQVSDEQFREWRQHPVTKAVHRYLEDHRRSLRVDAADRWESGETEGPEKEGFYRGIATADYLLAHLEWAGVLKLYGRHSESESE